MNGNKPWYASKTYHGLFVILIGLAVGQFGGEVSPELHAQIGEMVGGVLSIVGVLLAANGRNRAQGKITMKKSLKKE